MTTAATETRKKWTSKAGPRQTKAVQEAMRKLSARGQSVRILSGVIGKTEGWDREHESVAISLFGPQSPASVDAAKKIAEQFDWTITRDNYKAVVNAFEAAAAALVLPIRDERRTPEEDAKRRDEMARRENERNRKELETAAAISAKVKELREKCPWVVDDQKLSQPARAARNMKIELQKAFPRTVFSVTTRRFSGGDSIDVRWTDGPTVKHVQEFTDKYVSGKFDGMTDGYDYDNSIYGRAVDIVFGRTKYIDLIREANEGLKAKAKASNEEATDATAAELNGCHVEKHRHTKRGVDVWIVVLDSRVDRDEFERLRSECKQAGGWYSRQWRKTPGGFAFETEEAANEFAATIGAEEAGS